MAKQVSLLTPFARHCQLARFCFADMPRSVAVNMVPPYINKCHKCCSAPKNQTSFSPLLLKIAKIVYIHPKNGDVVWQMLVKMLLSHTRCPSPNIRHTPFTHASVEIQSLISVSPMYLRLPQSRKTCCTTLRYIHPRRRLGCSCTNSPSAPH